MKASTRWQRSTTLMGVTGRLLLTCTDLLICGTIPSELPSSMGVRVLPNRYTLTLYSPTLQCIHLHYTLTLYTVLHPIHVHSIYLHSIHLHYTLALYTLTLYTVYTYSITPYTDTLTPCKITPYTLTLCTLAPYTPTLYTIQYPLFSITL